MWIFSARTITTKKDPMSKITFWLRLWPINNERNQVFHFWNEYCGFPRRFHFSLAKADGKDTSNQKRLSYLNAIYLSKLLSLRYISLFFIGELYCQKFSLRNKRSLFMSDVSWFNRKSVLGDLTKICLLTRLCECRLKSFSCTNHKN